LLALRKATQGPDHPNTLTCKTNLARCYQAAKKHDRALPLFEEILAIRRSTFGPNHSLTLTSMNDLADGYQAAGKLDQALPLFEETLAHRRATQGREHRDTLQSMNNLASGYQAAGEHDKALPLYEEILRLTKAARSPEHPSTLLSMDKLARGYQEAGKLDRSVSLLREFADLWKRRAGADSLQYRGALAALGLNLLQLEKWTEAESVLREVLTILETKTPDAWQTFNVKAKLGGALLGQKEYSAAEPLLRAAYEGMKLRAQKIPPQRRFRIAEALDQLIKLAEATNKPDEARTWKDERKKYDPGKGAGTAQEPEEP
jgi:serine/threonine-protein kinase